MFKRRVEFWDTEDGWKVGLVIANIKRVNGVISEDWPLAKVVAGSDKRERIDTIFCRLMVGLTESAGSDNSGRVLFRLEVLVDDVLVASAEKIEDVSVNPWLKHHRFIFPLSELMRCDTAEELEEKILQASIKSIIGIVLENAQTEDAEVYFPSNDSVQACILFEDGEMFLQTPVEKF